MTQQQPHKLPGFVSRSSAKACRCAHILLCHTCAVIADLHRNNHCILGGFTQHSGISNCNRRDQTCLMYTLQELVRIHSRNCRYSQCYQIIAEQSHIHPVDDYEQGWTYLQGEGLHRGQETGLELLAQQQLWVYQSSVSDLLERAP